MFPSLVAPMQTVLNFVSSEVMLLTLAASFLLLKKLVNKTKQKYLQMYFS